MVHQLRSQLLRAPRRVQLPSCDNKVLELFGNLRRARQQSPRTLRYTLQIVIRLAITPEPAVSDLPTDPKLTAQARQRSLPASEQPNELHSFRHSVTRLPAHGQPPAHQNEVLTMSPV